MPNEEDKRFEQITLHTPGPIPGIPGDHAPGVYKIDWQERTITPVYATQPLVEEPLQGDLQAGEAPQPDNTLAADQSGIQA